MLVVREISLQFQASYSRLGGQKNATENAITPKGIITVFHTLQTPTREYDSRPWNTAGLQHSLERLARIAVQRVKIQLYCGRRTSKRRVLDQLFEIETKPT